MDYLFYPKRVCAICNHKFQVYYCTDCKRPEYGLCKYCHHRNKAHIDEIKWRQRSVNSG